MAGKKQEPKITAKKDGKTTRKTTPLKSVVTGYNYFKEDNWFIIRRGEEVLTTLSGRRVQTGYESLAKRLVEDLTDYGEDPVHPDFSLVGFHYSMIDFFTVKPRKELERSVAIGLLPENDWTFNCPTAAPERLMQWIGLYGTLSTQAEDARSWLSKLTTMQLCSVCIVGRVMGSVNLPYIVATHLDRKYLKKFSKTVTQHYPYIETRNLEKLLERFLFYFELNVCPKKVSSASGGGMNRFL